MRLRLPQLSARAIVLMAISMLTIMIVSLAAKEIVGNWKRLTQLRTLKEGTTFSDQLFDTMEKISVERDVASSMLEASDQRSVSDLRSRLADSRLAVDQSFARTVAEFETFDFPELRDIKANIANRYSKIAALRLQIDDALRSGQNPDATLPVRWTEEVSQLVSQTKSLWISFIRHFTSIDPIVTQHLRYKHLMRTITDAIGEQRSLIGRLIVEGKAPTVEQVAELARQEGIIAQSWQMSRILADQSGLYAPIAASYNGAESHYATLRGMINDVFLTKEALSATIYPFGPDLWFEIATETTDSLIALRDVATRQTRNYVEGLISQSEAKISVQAIFFVCALLLCGFGYWVVTVRVMGPINGMIEALLGAIRGERVAATAPEDRHDEIGKLAKVLHAFQKNAEDVKQTALELDRSESQLRAVVDHAVDGLIAIDARGIIRSFNPACERIFGWRAEEVVGKNIKTLMPEPYAREHDGYLSRYHATGQAQIIGSAGRELSAKRKDGSIFPIDLSVSAFTIEGERHFSGIVRDITARKEAEHALIEHTKALERSNKELDDFAYIASHDLKEPLRGIHNHSRFLLEDNAEKLDAESTGRLNRLVYLSQRMERLVNDLLYFSRLGRQELAIQATDLNAVIADIEGTLESFLQERGAHIVVPARLPVITCDKPRVTELFRNLITNAVKYSDKADKTVEIGYLDSHPTAEGQVARHVLYVKDNGRGIDREFHQEIFRIFKRLQAGKDKEEGTGVGLTFVKKIVERHGGRIWLESELGTGTTFYFTLEASHDEHDFGEQAVAA